MKVRELEGLRAALKKSYPVYVVAAKEEFDRHLIEKKVLASLLGDEDPALRLKAYDADKTSLNGVLDELNSFGLFGGGSIVLLRGVESLRKGMQDGLTAYLENPSPDATLVLVGESLRSNTRLYRSAEATGLVVDLPTKKPWERERDLPQWVVKQVEQLGKKIASAVGQELVAFIGQDKESIRRELEKLACYVGDRAEITREDVAKLCLPANLSSIFDLGNAVFRGDASAALRMGRGMLKDGVPLPVLLRQLRGQMQTDSQVFSILSSGGTPEDVTREFGYMRGRILQQHIDAARRYGIRRLRRGLLLIDRSDIESKNSGLPAEVILDRLLAKLTAA